MNPSDAVVDEPAIEPVPFQDIVRPFADHRQAGEARPESPAENRAPPVDVLPPQPPVPLLRQPHLSPDRPEVTDKQPPPPRRSVVASVPRVETDPLKSLVGVEDTTVDFTSNPPPLYPAEAVARRVEGVVTLKLHVSQAGKVERVELVTSSGSRLLDQAAMAAVAAWQGIPATRFGHPISTIEILPIRFRL